MTNFLRLRQIDSLRGLAIILVVIGHVLQFQNQDNYLENYFFNLIYLFHMPLFFFISGYTYKLNSKYSISHALLFSKVLKLLSVWFVWTLLAIILSNEHFSFDEIMQFYWFLPVLSICLLFLWSYFLLKSRLKFFIHLFFIFLLWLLLFISNSTLLSQVRYHIVFFFIGFFFNEKYIPNILKEKKLINIFMLFMFTSYLYYSDSFDAIGNITGYIHSAIRLLFACILILFLFLIQYGLRAKLLELFGYLGKFTLQIYLIHLLLIRHFPVYDSYLYSIFLIIFLTTLPILFYQYVTKYSLLNKILFQK